MYITAFLTCFKFDNVFLVILLNLERNNMFRKNVDKDDYFNWLKGLDCSMRERF